MDKTKASVAMFSRQTHIFIINLLALTVYSKHTSFMRRADKLSTCLHGKDLLNPPPWTEEQVVFTSSPQADVAVPTFPGWFIYSQRTGVERTRVVVVAAGSMVCNIRIYLQYTYIFAIYMYLFALYMCIFAIACNIQRFPKDCSWTEGMRSAVVFSSLSSCSRPDGACGIEWAVASVLRAQMASLGKRLPSFKLRTGENWDTTSWEFIELNVGTVSGVRSGYVVKRDRKKGWFLRLRRDFIGFIASQKLHH